MHSAKELILKKRDGAALSRSEIRAFVDGVTDGRVSDAQIAAFAMAIWFRGMEVRELTDLTLAMRDSGQVLEWQGLEGPVVDKHSTGGVGDLVSLLLAPVVAACGAFVPMISGRGLGHTGGTLDKLESIPGFSTSPETDRFQNWVRQHGLAIVGQSRQLAPADRRIYAVRDLTATVASTALIVSSILSKKLAEGLNSLVMDIKYGNGAFSERQDDAWQLAAKLCQVAESAGLRCSAVLTNMDQPLARSAGNALEVLEVVRFLRGDARDPRVLEVVLELGAELLTLAGLAPDGRDGWAQAEKALETGAAAERFNRMVQAQGGPGDFLEDAERQLPAAAVQRPVFPREPGFVTAVDTRSMGVAVVEMGGGRQQAEDRVDPAVGLSDILPIGSQAGPDRPLATVHAADQAAWARAAESVIDAFTIGADRVEPPVLIGGKIQGDHHEHKTG